MAWYHLVLVALIGTTAAQSPFSLEDFLGGSFGQRGFNGTWISYHEFTYTQSDPEDRAIYIYSAIDDSSNVLVPHELMESLDTRSPILSADRKFILAPSQVEQVYRYSRLAVYTLHEIESSISKPVADGNKLQLCIFGGGHSLAYVFENNVFYLPENTDNAIQITFDGKPGVIYNGHTDWVYEEDVFYTSQATWFSPNGNYLAFASFDDTEVETYSYYYYVDKTDPEDLYPEKIDLKYPKAGTKNPTVKLRVLSLNNLVERPQGDYDFIVVEAPQEVTSDHILGGVTWVSNTEIAAQWLNRRQNYAVLVIFDVISRTVAVTETLSEPNGWVNLGLPSFSKDGSYYMSLRWSLEQGDGIKWQHLVQSLRIGDNIESHSVTPGNFTVDTYLGMDEDNVIFYFTRTEPGKPYTRSVQALGSGRYCLSCNLQTPEGEGCTWASGSLSHEGHYIAVTCNPSNDPSVVFIMDARANTVIRVWEENQIVRERLQSKIKPKNFITTVPLENRVEVPVRMFLPPDFDENDKTKKYPVIFYVYSGPNTNTVSESFSVGYHSYLTTNRSVIYMMADGRGSGRQGQDMLFAVNNVLGTVEIEDHIVILRRVLERFDFIDKERVGIWGHSYGGYATLVTLIRDQENLFKCGITTAPVTSWLYYNTMYTERFMGLPTEEDNWEGYANGDVTHLAEELRNKKFLLMHGNADDNVHFQNAAKLMTKLQQLNIDFEQMSYPDEAHSLGRRAGLHRYSTMDHFWTRCLNL